MTVYSFGRSGLLTYKYDSDTNSKMRVKCQCDCGNTTEVRFQYLKTFKTKSCGCLLHQFKKTHGLTDSPAYISYVSMRRRVENPNYVSFHRYGGRGITIDPSWSTFEGFYADMGNRPEGTTLDRIDNDGPYSKENCRWTTSSQQGANRATTILNAESVRALRRFKKDGWTYRELIELTGLKFGCLASAVQGKTWKWV